MTELFCIISYKIISPIAVNVILFSTKFTFSYFNSGLHTNFKLFDMEAAKLFINRQIATLQNSEFRLTIKGTRNRKQRPVLHCRQSDGQYDGLIQRQRIQHTLVRRAQGAYNSCRKILNFRRQSLIDYSLCLLEIEAIKLSHFYRQLGCPELDSI